MAKLSVYANLKKGKSKKQKLLKQVGAIVYRRSETGIKILIITSRASGRWILPKGWPMPKKSDQEAARIEAWEEAGVKRIKNEPKRCGSLRYDKNLQSGISVPIDLHLYSFEATKLAKNFPERGQRNMRWVRINTAIRKLEQPELKKILKRLNHEVSKKV